MRLPYARLLLAAFAVFVAVPVTAQTTTMIVMDGSGSMWGQIDGRTKLEIARETVTGVLGTLPESRVIGLMAYGHRERGNCADIELMVPPAAGTAPQILDAVNAMRFQGKTPLTEAVRLAAEALRSTEEPATVVLVTDGIETCEADPCALATELEASGVDFTAHVIGFGLTRDEGAEVACIAENTGGRYLPASDADALAGALEQAISDTPPPEIAPLEVPETVRESRRFPGDVWMQGFALAPTGYAFGPDLPEPAAFDFPGDGTAEQCRSICEADGNCGSWRYEPAGSFFVDHARCFAFPPGTEFRADVYPPEEGFISGMKPGTVGLTTPYIGLGAPATASLTLTGPVAPGEEFTVLWSGPANGDDWIEIARPGSDISLEEFSWVYSAETIEPGDRPEGAASLIAPAEAGIYELRYVLGRRPDRRMIFSMPLPVGVGAPVPALLPVQIIAPAGFAAERISWSATPLDPVPGAPEAIAIPEAFVGPWEAELLPGGWRIEGLAESGMFFAGEITVAVAPGQVFEIPVGFESEGMGEDAAPAALPGIPFTEPETGLSALLPTGWTLSEAFFAETAAGVRSDHPTATFSGPDDRSLVLNPLQWLEGNGSCLESPLGPLCLFGTEDAATDAAMATLLPSLSLTPRFGGTAFTPQGDDPMSRLVPGWSAE